MNIYPDKEYTMLSLEVADTILGVVCVAVGVALVVSVTLLLIIL